MTVSSSSSMLGYNGVLHEVHAPWQILGNGYRVYNPVLMRFHSPDSLSPFGKGGLNPYAYCHCNPVNLTDPSGHWSITAFAANLFGFKLRTAHVTPVLVTTAGTFAAVGLAFASTNDTQRGLAIGSAVVLAAGALWSGRYAWTHRKILPRSTQSVGTPSAPPSLAPTPPPSPSPARTPTPTSTTGAAPGTVSTPPTGGSPAPSAPPLSPQPRPEALRVSARAQQLSPRPNVPPPPPPTAAQMGRDRLRISQRVRVADIRRGSADWEVATGFSLA